ncbi:MAG TPA: class I SAM-dependent methyltransferase [Gemmataceae bacterium]|nr:class I SAM-dependent methyltransferase [Gemmataceae bacterium]
MNLHIEANRRLWDVWTHVHTRSKFYRVEAFKAGESSLKHIELQELGSVEGRRLLHLQCHFGLDTLSWARLGAQATGVDFSPEAIRVARSLAQELGLSAEFQCAELTELPSVLQGTFDVVFTSYGVLAWLPDLNRWANLIAQYLNPRGIFYMVEFHPVLGMFDDEGQELCFSYFADPQPLAAEAIRSYAGGETHEPIKHYQWNHSLGEVITALAAAGLHIEFVHEFPYSVHGCYHFLVEVAPEKFVMKDHPEEIPLLFSIRALRP